MLYQQFGAVVLPVAVLVLLATAKSLSVQLSRPLPPIFPRLMWALIAINQILVLPTLVGVDTHTHYHTPVAQRRRGVTGAPLIRALLVLLSAPLIMWRPDRKSDCDARQQS
jgi:hypothetical protein